MSETSNPTNELEDLLRRALQELERGHRYEAVTCFKLLLLRSRDKGDQRFEEEATHFLEILTADSRF